MSEVFNSPFKKPECGDMFTLGQITALKDILGGVLSLQIVGTDPGVVGPIIAPMSDDYAPTIGTLNPDGTFFIIPEEAEVYCVVLADGTQFTITAVQSAAYLGQLFPAKIIRVLAQGTTGDFSVAY